MQVLIFLQHQSQLKRKVEAMTAALMYVTDTLEPTQASKDLTLTSLDTQISTIFCPISAERRSSADISPSEKPLNPGGAVTNTETVVEGASAAALGMKAGQSYTETADNNRAITIEPGMGAAAMGLAASSAYDTAADRGNRANAAYGTPEKTAPAPKSAPKFSGAVDDRFADGAEYGETYATNYDPRRTAQRNAFLSDEYSNSVDAVRASNRAIGVDRIGMKFYANDNGQAQEISQEA